MRSRWLGCLLFAAAVACGGADDDGSVGPGPGGSTAGGAPGGVATPGGLGTTGGPSTAVPGGGTGASTPGAAGGAALGGAAPGGAAGAGGAALGGAGGTAAGAATMLPCDVQKVLRDKCGVCHSDPPTGAAPMPLVTPADFQAISRIKPGEKQVQRVKARIAETGQTSMPPPGRPQLSAEEKALLNAFLDGGAKGVPQASCGPTDGAPGGTGGANPVPGSNVNWETDCDYVQEFLAHQGQTATDTQPYNVTKAGDSYEIFWFTPKWNEKVHVIDILPVIDNSAVLHHWLLYMKERATEPNGSHNPDSGLQSADSALLSGWAPGNKSFVFPADVGMQVIQGSGARFGIEIHYNTSGNPARRTDRSGAKVCATKKLRTKEAATHWLGTQFIVSPFGGKFDASGICSVKQTSHIIAHSPHMHKTGRYMKTIVTKANGQKVTITDKPFSFDDQQVFPVDSPSGEIVVEAGDKIDTVCSYDSPGPMTFGPGTDSEMCYNFVIAWPVGSLSNGSAGIVGGKNTCIDGI